MRVRGGRKWGYTTVRPARSHIEIIWSFSTLMKRVGGYNVAIADTTAAQRLVTRSTYLVNRWR